MRCAVVRRINPRRAALLLIVAALALSAVSFDRLVAGNQPSGPSGLSATATDTSLTLSWDAETRWTEVEHEVKLAVYGAATIVVSSTSHTFSGLAANTSYTLYVRARYVQGGPGGWKSYTHWSSLRATTAPAAPRGLSATATSTSLTLSWTAASGATGYEVKLGANGATTAVSSGTSHTFSSLTASTSYTLYVRAKNGGGASGWSSLRATTALAAPRGLSATATNTSLTLSWTTVSDATGYEVKLGADGAVATPSGLSHTFSDLTAGTEYTLYVRAKNSGGTSDWSSLTATTMALPAPGGLSATATNTSLTLSWTAVSGATGYEVKLGVDGAVATPSGLSQTFSDLTAGTEHTLYARAKNSGGTSVWSSLTAATVPAAPSGLSATATNTSLTLSWTAVTGATSYEVKRGASGVATVSSGASHSFSGLTASTEYTLYVRAKNSGGTSDWNSLTATTMALPTPGGLRITRQGGVILELAWDRVAGATGYEVKRVAGTAETTVPNAGCCSVRFLDATADTTYTFTVRARNSSGISSWSAALSVTTGPPTPTGLSATTTSSSLTLTWSAVTGATSYEVKQGASGTVTAVAGPRWPRAGLVKQGASGTVTAVSSGVSHTFSGLTANTAYILYVRAKNSNGTSEWSLTSATTAPAAPSGLNVATTSSSLTLSWSAVTSATSYEVKQGSGTVTAVSSGTSHTFTGLTGGTEYTLYVRAKNSNGTSEWSSISATTSPAAPSGLSVTTLPSSLTLSWGSVTGATSYEVKRGASGTVTAVPSGASHTFTGLTGDTQYTLYVRAKNSGGTSPWSSISATTSLAAPSGLSVTGTTKTGLTLSWNAVTGATSYEVKRGANNGWGASGTVTAVSSGTSHTFTGLTANTSYVLYVRAKSSTGVSDWSSLSTAGTGVSDSSSLSTATRPVHSLNVAATNTSLTLSWTAVAGATGYEVKAFRYGPEWCDGTSQLYSQNGLVAATVSSATSHTFTGLTAGTLYTLHVRAKSSSGVSKWSSLSAATQPSPQISPSSLSATATSTSLTLSWTALAGVTSYTVHIYYEGQWGLLGRAIVSPGTTSHTFVGLSVNKSYRIVLSVGMFELYPGCINIATPPR